MIANPWVILAAVLAFFGFGAASYSYGDHHGVLTQKVADQGAIDQVKTDLQRQKTQAAAILKQSTDDLLAKLDAETIARSKLENQHAADQAITNALRDKYATSSLRFLAQVPGCRNGGSDSVPEAASTPSGDAPTVVQLPDALAGNIRQFALSCEALNNDYKSLYNGWPSAQ